jgi:hypothetical protein
LQLSAQRAASRSPKKADDASSAKHVDALAVFIKSGRFDFNVSKRSNQSGSLHAVYLGGVRVGYIQVREEPREGYTWTLSLLRPTGGGYMGTGEHVESCMLQIRSSIQEWLNAAMEEK